MIDLDHLPEKLRSIRREIRAQYLAEDGARPWIIGFSGGKDSTLLTHLVVETLLSIAPDPLAAILAKNKHADEEADD